MKTASALALVFASATAAAAFPATSTTSLNVRSGPGTGYPVVDQLQPGQTVEVTNRSGSWYQVDGQGWASAAYLEASGSAAAVDEGYAYADYGYPAFYYDDYPYYWDTAGFYFFIRDGRRHRVDRDWWRRHHRDIRWDRRWRDRDWEGPRREARRGDDQPRIERRIQQRAEEPRIPRREVVTGEGGGRGEFRRIPEGRASAGGPAPRMSGGGEFRRSGGGGGEFRRGGGGGGGGQMWLPRSGGGGGGGRHGG